MEVFMESIKSISDSEWKVMEILWAAPGMLIGEIRDALKSSGWSYSTIKTLVLRLTQKGCLRAEDTAKGKRYFPAVDEETSKRKETMSLIDRIYSGSVRMMFSNLVKDSKLTESEASELLSLIDKMD